MNDRSITLRSAVSCLLWTTGVVLALLETLGVADIGELGVVAAAAGATLSVRGFVAELERRDRNAFELGRDHERHLRSLP